MCVCLSAGDLDAGLCHLEHLILCGSLKGSLGMTKAYILHESYPKLVTGQHLINNFVEGTLKTKTQGTN